MAIGKRTKAIAILGTHVMNPRGLVGLGLDSLDVCRQEIKQVFEVLANPSNFPLLIHCTQGKDRTGLVVQLVLFLLGVGQDTIQLDYMMTDSELVSEKDARIEEIRSIGLDDSFAACDVEMVHRVHEHLVRQGGIEKYLSLCGVDQDMQESVKSILRSGGVSAKEFRLSLDTNR
jgi:protein-tyrosine phosphatase